jgi:hypothetical protein
MAELLFRRIEENLAAAAKAAYREQFANRTKGVLIREVRAEAAILKDWPTAFSYARDVLRGRWPEFETLLDGSQARASPERARAAYNYCRYVVQDRYEPAEKHIATSALAAVDYAKEILGRPWCADDADYEQASTAIECHPTAYASYVREVTKPTPLARAPG